MSACDLIKVLPSHTLTSTNKNIPRNTYHKIASKALLLKRDVELSSDNWRFLCKLCFALKRKTKKRKISLMTKISGALFVIDNKNNTDKQKF